MASELQKRVRANRASSGGGVAGAGASAGEALPAYCLADLSPVENAGKGAEIPRLASFQTSHKIGAGEIASWMRDRLDQKPPPQN